VPRHSALEISVGDMRQQACRERGECLFYAGHTLESRKHTSRLREAAENGY
jgi:hypothetical protein